MVMVWKIQTISSSNADLLTLIPLEAHCGEILVKNFF